MNTSTPIEVSTAYLLARIGLGLNIALHGLGRLPKLAAFAAEMREQFAQSILPGPLVYFSAYGIAIGEAVIGLLLLAGLFLRPALVAGALLMIALIGGTCLIENWNAAGIQMIYLAFYVVLLGLARFDSWSLDGLRQRKPLQ